MAYLIALPLIPLVGALLYSFAMFDRLLKVQHQKYRAEWEADGKPTGYFWRAQWDLSTSNYWARARCSLSWIFRTPCWVAESPLLASTLRRQRLAALVWNTGMVAWVATLYLMGR